jgi:glutamyl-tRNA synthetase
MFFLCRKTFTRLLTILQFNLKITRGNTVVAFEKLWFLQKAHAQRFAASGGPEFDEMVSRVSSAVEETHSLDKL